MICYCGNHCAGFR